MMYRCAPATSGSGKIVKKRGKSLRVDIHCHYLNTEAAAAVARHNPAQFDLLARFSSELTREVNAKQIQERAAKLTSIGQRLKDMDRMGIDVQAVSPAPHQTYYWCEPGEGAELARTVNERIAEIAAQWPERFVGLGSVPLQDAGLAVSELDYCVKQLGLRGVEINPSVNGLDLTDAKLGAQWPERFVGLGTVPLQDAGLAVSELDYCVKQLGLRGVEINPSVNGLDLTQQRDRQPARDHGRGEPSHLRRRDAAFPEAEGPAAARRRLPRAWTMRTAPARIAGSA